MTAPAPAPISKSQYPAALAETAGLARARRREILIRLASRPPAPRPAVPAPVAPEVPAYLTTREAAALLGVSVEGLEVMRARGTGPRFVGIGKAVRYLASNLEDATRPCGIRG